jgi:hypothetical protein
MEINYQLHTVSAYAKTTVPCYTLDIGLNSPHRQDVAANRKIPAGSWSRTVNIQVNALRTFMINDNRIIYVCMYIVGEGLIRP